MKKHNFYAGPSILSQYTIKSTEAAVGGEAVALVKELLEVPEGYSVLFLGGGASLQFAMAPMNFLNKKAAYLDTGVWASKAIKEAKLFGDVDVVASGKDSH